MLGLNIFLCIFAIKYYDMSKQVLTSEQMEELGKMGVDLRSASCYMRPNTDTQVHWGKCTEPYSVPLFTIDDVLSMLPEKIEHPTDDYYLNLQRSYGYWSASYSAYVKNGVVDLTYMEDHELIDALYNLLLWYLDFKKGDKNSDALW